MMTATGKSHRQDPGEHIRDIDGTTGELRLPTSSRAGLYCAAADRPWGISRLLVTTLCLAVLFAAVTVVLVAIEEVRGAPVATHTIMLLLVAATAIAWIAVIIVTVRDRINRNQQVLRAAAATIQARQQELYDRQEHLAHRITDQDNRLAEQMQLLRRMAADIAAIRRDMADVIGVADANAELQLRQAVNDSRPPTPGLYVVPVLPPEN